MPSITKKLLLVDAQFMCYRSAYTTGHLTHGGIPTGVTFGFLRDLDVLQSFHHPDIFVFAFDYGGKGLRGQLYPEYKANRKTQWTEEQVASFRIQVKQLYSEILPSLGYKNIFRMKGYEADDIIAKVAQDLDQADEAVIISADKDLYQCLSRNVSLYNPVSKTTLTIDQFIEGWGIDPTLWAGVKAMAGCTSDNIKGIQGVGEKTAAKWYADKIKPGSKVHESILNGYGIIYRNLQLVELPFKGLELPKIKEDEATENRKVKVESELGIRHNRRAGRKPKQEEVGFF